MSELKVTINEHRAPTDESMRFLREMHDLAMKSAREAVETKIDPIEAKVVSFQADLMDDVYYLCAEINGKRFTMRLEESPLGRKPDVLRALCGAIAEELTAQLANGQAFGGRG